MAKTIDLRGTSRNAFSIGGRNVTISATEPSSKAIGDQWLELDGTNYPKYGWHWRWNGSYWLSPDFREDYIFYAVPAMVGMAVNSSYGYMFCNPSFNYFLKSFNTNILTQAAQSGSNYWNLIFQRATAANVQTALYSQSTLGNAANTWVRTNIASDLHVNVASTGTSVFYFSLLANSINASTIYAIAEINFNLARI